MLSWESPLGLYFSAWKMHSIKAKYQDKIGFLSSMMEMYLPYPCIETVMAVYEIVSNTNIYQPSPGY